jgi:hypothetical protein
MFLIRGTQSVKGNNYNSLLSYFKLSSIFQLFATPYLFQIRLIIKGKTCSSFFLHFSAFDLLSDSSVKASVKKLRELFPDELKCLDGTEKVWNRVQINSAYEYFENEQQAEVNAIRKEQELIIPRDFDYSL